MLPLLRNPDQLQRLLEDPELLNPATDELPGYDSLVQFDIPVVREEMETRGKRLQAGQQIIAMTGAAHRAPKISRGQRTGYRLPCQEPDIHLSRHSFLSRCSFGAVADAGRLYQPD